MSRVDEIFPLGRLVPSDFVHVEKYPLRSVQKTTVAVAERTLNVPLSWIKFYDQGVEGSCVGFSCSYMMSILNRLRYDARWLYRTAQEIDEWPGTDYDGTSVRAGLDVLRDYGHRHYFRGKSDIESPAHGISVNRWATSIDEVRTCIAGGIPVVLGINWYNHFDEPQKLSNEYWLRMGPTSRIRGGHAICAYGVSDRRQAVKLVNSWGKMYPRVYMHYSILERLLLHEDGEASVVTDR